MTLDVRGGAEATTDEAAEELLDALQRRADAAHAVGRQQLERGVIGASFTVEAPSPLQAWELGLGIFRDALRLALPGTGTERWPLDGFAVTPRRATGERP